jgi:hypothetical protein
LFGNYGVVWLVEEEEDVFVGVGDRVVLVVFWEVVFDGGTVLEFVIEVLLVVLVGGGDTLTSVTLSIQGPIKPYNTVFPILNLGSKHILDVVIFAVKITEPLTIVN